MEFFPGDEVESLPVRLYAGRALGMATGLDLAGCILQIHVLQITLKISSKKFSLKIPLIISQ